MKVLPNEKFRASGEYLDPKMLSKIDFNVVSTIKSPSSIVFKNGFTSEIVVGFHTNVLRLVGELVYLGSKSFIDYLEGFSKHYNIELGLLNAFYESGMQIGAPKMGIDNQDLDNLMSFLSKNRIQLREFVDCLKQFRPKTVSKSFKSFKELGKDEYKYYISTIEVFDVNVSNPTVFAITSRKLIGSFNLNLPFDVPSNYDEKVEELSNQLESYGLGFCIESIVDEFKACNNDLFSPNAFRLAVYSMPMIYGFVYDVVYKKIRKLVKSDVNEG